MNNEIREALLTFGVCLFVSGGLGLWLAIVYWSAAFWRIKRRIEKVVGFVEEQEQLDRL